VVKKGEMGRMGRMIGKKVDAERIFFGKPEG
jgi:hypothetical protein